MTVISSIVRRPFPYGVGYFFQAHPEWWIGVLSFTAWIALFTHAVQHASHLLTHRVPFLTETGHWLLMVVAMMFPYLLNRIHLVAEYSLWHRRHRAMVGFLLGYLSPWLAAGLLVAALRQAPFTHSYLAAAVAFAAACLWQRREVYRRALANCHRRHTLAPEGLPADRDCLRSGARVGAACLTSCWPLMLGCTLTGHNILALAAGMIVGYLERRSYFPRPKPVLIVTASLAAVCLLLAFI